MQWAKSWDAWCHFRRAAVWADNSFGMGFDGMMAMSGGDACQSDWGWILGASTRGHGGGMPVAGIPVMNLGGLGIRFDGGMGMGEWG